MEALELHLDRYATTEQAAWLAEALGGLTTELPTLTVSEWAETRRYLPAAVSPSPGFYSFENTPYLREIADCLSVHSPIRHVSLQKGGQLGGTVGILENFVGYGIDHVKTSPMMLVTADGQLAKERLESYIQPMIQHSGLGHLIRSQDEGNHRKTGQTFRRVEWDGGGKLLAKGAQNASGLRSDSVWALLRDEVDGFPLTVGKDGDPIQLSEARTNAFAQSRKIIDISTPTVEGISRIHQLFLAGDQRYYYVPCLACGHMQVLRFRRPDNDTGEITGLTWDLDDEGRLVPGSSRYLCQQCAHPHTNDDKFRMLPRGEWRPSAVPQTPYHRSYHLSALYSPPFMLGWDACVQSWLKAWDPKANQVRDRGKLQVFYNLILGEVFAVRGDRVTYEAVSTHRRNYTSGAVPNQWCIDHCGGPVLFVTASVDVHKTNLAVAVVGHCRDRRSVLISYDRFEGDAENLDDVNTWGRLAELIETAEYTADDGRSYNIGVTLIDSGYRDSDVYLFCQRYESGVYPIKGQAKAPKAARYKEFSEFRTTLGTIAYGITVDLYKDRISAALKREWDGQGVTPTGSLHFPRDLTSKKLKELTVEHRVQVLDKEGNVTGFAWKRPSGAKNELLDLSVYNAAAFEIVCRDLWVNEIAHPDDVNKPVDWLTVWDYLSPDTSVAA